MALRRTDGEAHFTHGSGAGERGRAQPRPPEEPSPLPAAAGARETRSARRRRRPPAAAPDFMRATTGASHPVSPSFPTPKQARRPTDGGGRRRRRRKAERYGSWWVRGWTASPQVVCSWGDEGCNKEPATAPAAGFGGRKRERRTPLSHIPFSRLMAKRPSDRRSPGRNPGPQGAFEVSMINVSCNSH